MFLEKVREERERDIERVGAKQRERERCRRRSKAFPCRVVRERVLGRVLELVEAAVLKDRERGEEGEGR